MASTVSQTVVTSDIAFVWSGISRKIFSIYDGNPHFCTSQSNVSGCNKPDRLQSFNSEYDMKSAVINNRNRYRVQLTISKRNKKDMAISTC